MLLIEELQALFFQVLVEYFPDIGVSRFLQFQQTDD